MSGLTTFWWLSRRDWRQRDVRVVLASLVVAVAAVATISLFADHLRQTLLSSATQFLAADRQLSGSRPLPQEFLQEAEERGLESGQIISFSTMLYGSDGQQLVQAKGVSDDYPLAGEIEIQRRPDGPRERVTRPPPPGEIWLNARLLPMLDLSMGDSVEMGEHRLKVTAILVREPDAGFNMAALSPRTLMHISDVEKTGVVQPGSRVRYKQLYSGDEAQLESFHQWLEPQLDESQRWRTVRDGQPAIADALDRAERFLLLGGSLAVLLAAVAVAVASRQYALGQRDTVALLKTLGLPGRTISRFFIARLGLWGLIGTVAGLLLALPAYMALAAVTNRFLDQPVSWSVSPGAIWPALVTALVALFAFAYPPIHRLRRVPAMQVLRSQPGESGSAARLDMLIAVVGIFALLWFYGGEIWLVVALLLALVALLLAFALLSALFMALLRPIRGGGQAWRLALVALYRHRRASLSQMAVFAMTLMLAATLFLMRTALLEDWQAQLPEDAPNHFLINIASDQVDSVESFLGEREISATALYPMVRGRLTHINDEPVREAVSKDEEVNALNRELNLTWLEELPADNRLRAGEWWQEGNSDGVSVEAELFEELGLSLGDELRFRIGGLDLSAEVRNVREVQWDSMRPNFYMAFSPGTLEEFSATWITSFYMEDSDKGVLNDLTRAFPTVSVLELDQFIERIRGIVGQVTTAVEALLVMILISAVLVMAAVVSATLGDRQREGALLRTLGARRQLLVRSTMLEFAALGAIAGLLGVMAAEVAVWSLQYRLFEGRFVWHGSLWLTLPVLSALVLSLFGRWQLGTVLNVSPMLLMRRLEG
ncbi:MAG: FtsX-like permease family protein [Oleiphilaceae bacterium]|nr:FtsX-like permease family protein [Oleiphilaceae bacterium]